MFSTGAQDAIRAACMRTFSLNAEPCLSASWDACAAPQVPQGATPRSLHVHLRGALTRCAKPGDAVTISGVFLPQPLTGFRVRPRTAVDTASAKRALPRCQHPLAGTEAVISEPMHASGSECSIALSPSGAAGVPTPPAIDCQRPESTHKISTPSYW